MRGPDSESWRSNAKSWRAAAEIWEEIARNLGYKDPVNPYVIDTYKRTIKCKDTGEIHKMGAATYRIWRRKRYRAHNNPELILDCDLLIWMRVSMKGEKKRDC